MSGMGLLQFWNGSVTPNTAHTLKLVAEGYLPKRESSDTFKLRCRTCKKEKKSTEFYFAHSYSETLRPDCIKCGNKSRRLYSWEVQKRGWPYRGDVNDAEYLRDRQETFNNNGNGWWWFVGNNLNKYRCRH